MRSPQARRSPELKADVEKLEALLATERERADKAITGFEALLRTESERADRAIAAFESLAQRLKAMAAAKRRGGGGWWVEVGRAMANPEHLDLLRQGVDVWNA